MSDSDVTALEPRRTIATTFAEHFELATIDDATLIDHLDNLRIERDRARDYMHAMVRVAEQEIEFRLRDRGAKQIPHPTFECGLEDEFGQYTYDLQKLREAKALLPDVEAAKVMRHVPEHVEIIASHDVPGSAISINALAKKYKGSHVGELLSTALSRPSLGTRFIFRRRRGM